MIVLGNGTVVLVWWLLFLLLWQKQLKGERVCLAHGFRRHIKRRNAAGARGAGHIPSAVREPRAECWFSAQFSFPSVQDPNQKISLHSSIKSFYKHLHSQIQRCIFMVILNPVKLLTVKINHHNRTWVFWSDKWDLPRKSSFVGYCIPRTLYKVGTYGTQPFIVIVVVWDRVSVAPGWPQTH